MCPQSQLSLEYEKAVPWGKGSGSGESDEAKILVNLLAAEYAFGNGN